ncbi:MAG: NmrA family NAD(P)-binding protein [Spirochaetaceae bacterium]|nr:NmrA family NAD(P)-binding protein [Spirochaetaceae bacterium]MCF7949190.1 NmrA family NAD(P)-binding protein [Spirochaetia bacterium]MCF7951202.1 NmrA family NAD(P)-binding protein [Spirochaetaceae bacterium]
MNLLITGITGNFGYAVYKVLKGRSDLEIYAGARNPERVNFLIEDPEINVRRFDFDDAGTYEAALEGIEAVVLVRPPAITKVKSKIFPFIDMCRHKNIQHILFLSLQGVESRPYTPHYKIEHYIEKSGIPYTFLRPSFFMENLITAHREEIRYESRLLVPAGEGKTNFIAVDDIARAAARCIGNAQHYRIAYELTGEENYSYYDVARILSEELGRTISYEKPGMFPFMLYRLKKGEPLGFVLVMSLIYRAVKTGKGADQNENLSEIFGVTPTDLREFIRDRRTYFELDS